MAYIKLSFWEFDQRLLNLNSYYREYSYRNFYDNVNQRFEQREFQDIAYIATAGSDLYVGGYGVKFDTFMNVTSGNVTGLLVASPTGIGPIVNPSGFALLDFSMNAKRFYDALLTLENYDDQELLTELLSGPDVVEVGTGSAYIETLGGNDRFYVDSLFSNEGPVTLDGGDGLDIISFVSPREDFQQTVFPSYVSVGLEGRSSRTLSLYSIERLEFSNSMVAFDTSGIGGQAYRIYKAAFDRVPDSGGLGYWIAQMDEGMDMAEVAARFINSDEFRSLYGQNPTNGEFLNKVYLNVLDRLPDAGGYDWWMDQLENNPEKTWEKVLADFSESPENQANVTELIANGIVFDPWVG